MNTYRLWAPAGTYCGTVEADTEARALLKRHREDVDSLQTSTDLASSTTPTLMQSSGPITE